MNKTEVVIGYASHIGTVGGKNTQVYTLKQLACESYRQECLPRNVKIRQKRDFGLTLNPLDCLWLRLAQYHSLDKASTEVGR